MTRTALLIPLILGLTAVRPAAAEESAEARRIMEAVDARDDGDTMESLVEMVLIDKNGSKRVRKLQAYSRDRGEDTDRIVFFEEPRRVKDTGFLTFDYRDPERNDDQWLYLPALHKTRRIVGSDKSDSFMGSDFTFADMTRAHIEAYDFRLVGEVDIGGHPAWQIEADPRSEAEIERTGYSKSVLFVRKDCYVVVRAVHWLTSGNRVKYLDIKQLEQVDGIWTAIETHMTTKQRDRTLHRTILRNLQVSYNGELDEDLFTMRRLSRGI